MLPWILAGLSMGLLAIASWLHLARRRKASTEALPREWALAARPVFSSTERKLHRLLVEALPQCVILSKLPLVRFCQPIDPATVRYWYTLLGSSHVSFAICSSSGRVLAAIDIEGARPPSQRSSRIKSSALTACKVRYLRCTVDHLPSVPELQALIPAAGSSTTPRLGPAAAARARAERTTLWQDSGFMQDSFFGLDGRGDISTTPGALGSLRPASTPGGGRAAPVDVGGVVVDTPVSPLRH